jgi:formamidopyrimidine-DNA glycosylase
MPEMPEVETLARKLRKKLIGKCISRVHLSGLSLRRPIDRSFAARLQGHTVRKISRRGKYLIAELEPRAFWLIHLGMSGRILYHSGESAGAKHTHVTVQFSDSTELEYSDPRRFGLMDFYEVEQLEQIPEIRSLGMDPLSSALNGEWLGPHLKRSRQEIKSFLLDQRKIAGLGNIYACEALFLAQIHPRRRCFTITGVEKDRLVIAIKKVLSDAIRRRGTSFSDFVDSDGKLGQNQNFLTVFQRDGKECARCGTLIRRILHGNRSSFYCPNCQD